MAIEATGNTGKVVQRFRQPAREKRYLFLWTIPNPCVEKLYHQAKVYPGQSKRPGHWS